MECSPPAGTAGTGAWCRKKSQWVEVKGNTVRQAS
jgi:hypothetical protein